MTEIPEKRKEYGNEGQDEITNTKQITSKMSRVKTKRKYLIVPIIFLHVFTFIMCSNTITLFYPVLLRRTLFPHTSLQQSKQSVCETNLTSSDQEVTRVIQARVSEMLIYVGLVIGVPAVVANILLGSFSDQFGRKPQLLIPTIAILVKESLTALFIFYEVNILFFLVAFFIEGIVGTTFSVITVSFSYMADVTDNNKERTIGIAVLQVAIGLGALFGGLAAGYFIDGTGYVLPIATSCGLMIIDILMIIFLLPETVHITKKRRIRFKTIISYLKSAFQFYFVKNDDGNRWVYDICIVVLFLSGMTLIGRNSVEIVYAISPPFCWDTIKVGWFSFVKHFVQEVALMALIRVFVICMNDETIAIIGSVSAVVGFIVQGLATSDILLYFSPVVGACGALTVPMIRAIMSKLTPGEKQGAMFGGTFAVETLTSSGGTMIFNQIYKETSRIHNGIVFFVMAGINFIALILLFILAVFPRKLRQASYTL